MNFTDIIYDILRFGLAEAKSLLTCSQTFPMTVTRMLGQTQGELLGTPGGIMFWMGNTVTLHSLNLLTHHSSLQIFLNSDLDFF